MTKGQGHCDHIFIPGTTRDLMHQHTTYIDTHMILGGISPGTRFHCQKKTSRKRKMNSGEVNNVPTT